MTGQKRILCPRCNGTGHIDEPAYKAGDRVLWDSGGWWGKKPATVLALSKSGQKVKIETDPNLKHNGGRPWITYVTLAKLEPHA
jgi:hypothetical protein